MIAQNPPTITSDLRREQGVPESTRMMQDGSYPVEAQEVAESRVLD